MTAFKGSCEIASALAAHKLAEADCTALEIKVGVQIAIRGDHAFETDNQIRAIIRKHGDGLYHRESIGRARRRLQRLGLIESKRIYCGQKCPRMRYPSPHGTTDKCFRWDRLGVRNPMPRRERAIAAARAQGEARRAERSTARDRPRFASVPVVLDPNAPARPLSAALSDLASRDPAMARVIAAAAEASAKRQAPAAGDQSPDVRLDTGPPTPT